MSDKKLKLLLEQCAELEKTAGITEKVERAESGRFFPLGLGDDDCSPDEYFADEHDHFREHIRDAYFSVQDSKLRKELIAARRLVDSELDLSYECEAKLAHSEEASASLKELINNYTKAALISIVSVMAGYAIFQIPGCIAGAVAGYFVGNGVIEYKRISASTAYINAKENLKCALDNLARSKLHFECFTREEQYSGDRDKDFDNKSSLLNLRTAQKI